jgi:hypothetical protein
MSTESVTSCVGLSTMVRTCLASEVSYDKNPMDANVVPVQWMSGPILNLVLTDRFAYFVSYTYTEGAGGSKPVGQKVSVPCARPA